ncbi:hypothetical protein THF5H11_200016 [Vibrio jasicida]|nr:hypothetical protein THF5H11_200016 [Vibrio jasicida]
MDLSDQIKKMRVLNNALSDPSLYITRVVTDSLNSPFLIPGDLVAFESAPTQIDSLSEDCIYLFVYEQHETIGFSANDQVRTLKTNNSYQGIDSIHRMLFLSK